MKSVNIPLKEFSIILETKKSEYPNHFDNLPRSEINISVLDIDDGDSSVQFLIEVSNGAFSASQDFYGYPNIFKDFAAGLLSFPKTIDDKVKFEIGESGEKWAYHILLDVFCHNGNGHSAIHIVLDNNRECPYTNKSEFYITTVPASLNNLGELLYDWDPIVNKLLRWIAE